jgi:hypothetical protein
MFGQGFDSPQLHQIGLQLTANQCNSGLFILVDLQICA